LHGKSQQASRSSFGEICQCLRSGSRPTIFLALIFLALITLALITTTIPVGECVQ